MSFFIDIKNYAQKTQLKTFFFSYYALASFAYQNIDRYSNNEDRHKNIDTESKTQHCGFKPKVFY